MNLYLKKCWNYTKYIRLDRTQVFFTSAVSVWKILKHFNMFNKSMRTQYVYVKY